MPALTNKRSHWLGYIALFLFLSCGRRDILTDPASTPTTQQNPAEPGQDRDTPLHQAILAQTDLASLYTFLQTRSINQPDNEGSTPLHRAVLQDNLPLVGLLLSEKATIDAQNAAGLMPLHLAAKQGNLLILHLLLIYHADIHAKDKEEHTPLDYINEKQHTDELQQLLQRTPWDAIASERDPFVVAWLLAAEKTRTKDTQGWTPLHLAACLGQTKAIQDLIANKANIEARNSNGWTPLHLAAFLGQTEAIQALLNNKAALGTKDNQGYTPLHVATLAGRLEAVQLLIDHQAPIDAIDHKGRTPYDIAQSIAIKELLGSRMNLGKLVFDCDYDNIGKRILGHLTAQDKKQLRETSTDMGRRLLKNGDIHLQMHLTNLKHLHPHLYPRLYPHVQTPQCVCLTFEPIPTDAVVTGAFEWAEIAKNKHLSIKNIVFKGQSEDLESLRDALPVELRDHLIVPVVKETYSEEEQYSGEQEYSDDEEEQKVDKIEDSGQEGYPQSNQNEEIYQEETTIVDPGNQLYNSFVGVKKLPAGKTKIEKYLAAGAFGKVYRGQWGDKSVALKQIDADRGAYKLHSLGVTHTEVEEAMQWEVARLSTVSHPNLVQFYGLYQNRNEGYTYMVMEFCEGGTLQEALKKENVPWAQRWQWALQISEALAYLHWEGVLHRDLKAENVLLDKQGRAKLADLGVAQVDALLQDKEAKVVMLGAQDKRFIAPETEKDQTLSTKETDIYALGLVLWQVATGKVPRKIEDLDSVEKDAWREGREREVIPTNCPKSIKALILECWAKEPKQRPTAQGVLAKLAALGPELDPYHHRLVTAVQKLEQRLHPKRKEGLAYIPPFVTQYSIDESIETYWARVEAVQAKAEAAQAKAEAAWTKAFQVKVEAARAKAEAAQAKVEALQAKAAQRIFTSFPLKYVKEKADRAKEKATKAKEKATKAKEEATKAKEEAAREKGERSPNPPLTLAETFKEFIETPKSNTLLLLGEAGLGKTLTTYQWGDQLLNQWWAHINTGTPAPAYFPIFIRSELPTWSHAHIKDAFQEVARKYNLPPGIQPLVFIDGYDELQLDEAPTALVEHLGLQDLGGSKLIVTCRPHTVEKSAQGARFGFNGALTTRHFLPFSLDQLLGYLQKELSEDEQVYQDYKNTLGGAESIRTVLRNPFVLHLFRESWETLSQRPLGQLNRWQIYEAFIEHTLQSQKTLLSKNVRKRLKDTYPNLLTSYQAFMSKVAWQAFEQKGIILGWEEAKKISPWTQLKQYAEQEAKDEFAQRKEKQQKALAAAAAQGQTERRSLLSEDDYVRLTQEKVGRVESELPLQLRGEGKEKRYEYSHKSLFEYGMAKRLLLLQYSPNIVQEGIQLLNSRKVQEEPEAIRFWQGGWKSPAGVYPRLRSGEAMTGSQTLIEPFFEIITRSRDEETIQQASANSATLLAQAEVPFSGRSLQGVRLPGADLSRAILSHTSLAGAQLPGCLLGDAYLSNADLQGANLTGVDFGQYPSLECKKQVYCLAYHPAGGQLAVGLEGGDIELYDQAEGAYRLLATLKGHSEDVNSVAYRPDGQQLASGSSDNTVGLWDTNSFQLVSWLKGHSGRVMSVSYHPDGQQLASGSDDKTVDLWDPSSHQQLALLKGHRGGVRSVCYRPDGQQLASASEDHTVGLWDPSSHQQLALLKGHRGWVMSVSYRPDGQQLASGSRDNTVGLWDPSSHQQLALLKGHRGWVMNVCYRRDGQQLASASDDETVGLWDPSSQEPAAGDWMDPTGLPYYLYSLMPAADRRDGSIHS